jgi:hypothetical protein
MASRLATVSRSRGSIGPCTTGTTIAATSSAAARISGTCRLPSDLIQSYRSTIGITNDAAASAKNGTAGTK